MGKFKFLFALLLGAFLGLSSRAEASSFTVNPVKISLSGREQSALLSLQNQSDEEIRFKINPQEWKQSPKGGMQLQDTKDVVVYPTLLTLGPNRSASCASARRFRQARARRAIASSWRRCRRSSRPRSRSPRCGY